MEGVTKLCRATVGRRFVLALPMLAVLASVAAAWGVVYWDLGLSRQGFPLCDDFSFSRLAFRFARGGGIRYDGWPAMPLIGQCVWAAPFVWVFGDSHVGLRLSTIVLAGLGVLATFDLLRSEPGVSARAAAFGAAAVAFNPFFFTLSGTFMSDVPGLAFSLVALALVRRGAALGSLGMMAAGGVAGVLATTSRQNALATPLACALLPAGSWNARRIALALGTAVPIVAGLAAVVWYGSQPNNNPRSIFAPEGRHVAEVMLHHAHVLGLTAVPLLLLRPSRVLRPGFLFWLAVFGGWTVAWLDCNWRWYRQPYFNHIRPTPGDLFMVTGVLGEQMPEIEFWVVTALKVGGCFGLAGLFAGPGGRSRLGGAGRSLLAFSALQLLLMFMTRTVFDRYLVVLLPAVALRTVPRRSPAGRPRWWAGLAALGVVAALSVGVAHDWLCSMSARWALCQRAVARGVVPTDIEGGLEWNGWHSPQTVSPLFPAESASQNAVLISARPISRFRPSAIKPNMRSLARPFTRLAFPDVTGRHAVSAVQPGTTVVDSEPYRLWLAPGTRRLLLIRVD